ncbi:hypothetical protein FIBSPDRAFT_935100 [Athelia psychrophila]|uniref:Uncharacterized protein n=1 Tax=Athelia psychrophila TaxID=1759441 RepID=A0A166E8U3_9AGAM|nr:hypothetical protein FIBSPDRAFT_935100 [Fibularhizoctonia sp. CBS 109695]
MWFLHHVAMPEMIADKGRFQPDRKVEEYRFTRLNVKNTPQQRPSSPRNIGDGQAAEQLQTPASQPHTTASPEPADRRTMRGARSRLGSLERRLLRLRRRTRAPTTVRGFRSCGSYGPPLAIQIPYANPLITTIGLWSNVSRFETCSVGYCGVASDVAIGHAGAPPPSTRSLPGKWLVYSGFPMADAPRLVTDASTYMCSATNCMWSRGNLSVGGGH